jgi:hypothetical protein
MTLDLSTVKALLTELDFDRKEKILFWLEESLLDINNNSLRDYLSLLYLLIHSQVHVGKKPNPVFFRSLIGLAFSVEDKSKCCRHVSGDNVITWVELLLGIDMMFHMLNTARFPKDYFDGLNAEHIGKINKIVPKEYGIFLQTVNYAVK